MAPELEARVSGDPVVKLQNWASLWADLMHVDMVLHARDQLTESPANLFARRALWEGAVIAYGRTAKTGRRQVLVKELLDTLGPDAQQCHDEVMKWRDKHIAHRQDRSHETVTARAIIEPSQLRVLAVRVRVSPATGDEDGGELVSAFKDHIKALRDLVWEYRLRPLEELIVAESADDVERLLSDAAPDTMPSGYFNIDISPSGQPQQASSAVRSPNRAERRKSTKVREKRHGGAPT